VTPNVKESIGKTYTITREFNASFKKDDLKGYNPYIIVKYADGQKDRTEVHLPKYKATSLANQSLIGTNKDAYYIDREGAYPFAIDIPVLGFKPVTERQRIDSEYPDFTKWAESKGAKYTDWYDNYTGPRK
jgi:LruC domain-containing protein